MAPGFNFRVTIGLKCHSPDSCVQFLGTHGQEKFLLGSSTTQGCLNELTRRTEHHILCQLDTATFKLCPSMPSLKGSSFSYNGEFITTAVLMLSKGQRQSPSETKDDPLIMSPHKIKQTHISTIHWQNTHSYPKGRNRNRKQRSGQCNTKIITGNTSPCSSMFHHLEMCLFV